MKLFELIREVNTIETDAEGIILSAKTANRDLTADENTKLDAMTAKKADLKRQMETEMVKPAERTISIPEEKKAPKELSLRKEWEAEARERFIKETSKISFRDFVSPETQRAITTAVGISTMVAPDVTNYLTESNFIRKFAAHKVASANLSWPVGTVGTPAAIVAEGATLTDNAITVATVPFTQFTLPVFRTITQELLESSAWNVISEMDKLAGLSLGLGELGYMLTGTGTGQPQGLITGGTNGTTATVATTVYTDFVNLIFRMPKAYRDGAVLLVSTGVLPILQNATFGGAGGFPMLTYVNGDPVFLGKYPVIDTGYGFSQTYSTTGNKIAAFVNFGFGYGITDQIGSDAPAGATEGTVQRNIVTNPNVLGVIAQYWERLDARVLDATACQILTVK